MRAKSWLRWGGLALLVGGLVILIATMGPYFGSALTVIPTAPVLTVEPVITATFTVSPTAATAPTPTLTPATTNTGEPATLTPAPTKAPTLTPSPRSTPTGEVPVQISIADIDLDAPVLTIGWEYVISDGQRVPVWAVPDEFAAGWHQTSAQLGLVGNTVINGHNTSNGEVFRDLYKLESGAIIEVTGESGEVYSYQVTEKYILPEAGQTLAVRLKNAEYIQETPDERLTLVTCHPYGSLRNRLIIIAKLENAIISVSTPDAQKGE